MGRSRDGRSGAVRTLRHSICSWARLTTPARQSSLPDNSCQSEACHELPFPASHSMIISGRKSIYWSKRSAKRPASRYLFRSRSWARYSERILNCGRPHNSGNILINCHLRICLSALLPAAFSGRTAWNILSMKLLGKGKSKLALTPSSPAKRMLSQRAIPPLCRTTVSFSRGGKGSALISSVKAAARSSSRLLV